MPIRKHYYFVSYAWQNTMGISGFGNEIVSLDTLVMDQDAVDNIERTIREATGYIPSKAIIAILWWQYLREEVVDDA